MLPSCVSTTARAPSTHAMVDGTGIGSASGARAVQAWASVSTGTASAMAWAAESAAASARLFSFWLDGRQAWRASGTRHAASVPSLRPMPQAPGPVLLLIVRPRA